MIDTPYEAKAIEDAVVRCVEDEVFRAACREVVNPYGAGDAGRRIAEILATTSIDRRLVQKKMTY